MRKQLGGSSSSDGDGAMVSELGARSLVLRFRLIGREGATGVETDSGGGGGGGGGGGEASERSR